MDLQTDCRQVIQHALEQLGYSLGEQAGEALSALTEVQPFERPS